MSNFIIKWWRRRKVIKRLIAFAKTKEGRRYIEELNGNNLILADMDAYDLGAENPYLGKTLRVNIPKDYITSIPQRPT